MSCQFIIISLTEERKNKTIDLLNTNNHPIHIIEASTIQNSNMFLPKKSNLDLNTLKIICCTKSHLRAIELACQDDSPEYSIILEDDVTFHINFYERLDELINKWENDDKYSELEMLNIGWVPCNNYEHYNSSTCKSFDELSQGKLLDYFYSVGLQGYIIKKSKINDYIKNIILSETFFEYSLKIIDKIGRLTDSFKSSNSIYAIDNVLNKLLKFAVLFPPIIIERNEPSTLGHDNKNDYWNKYFYDNEEKTNYIL